MMTSDADCTRNGWHELIGYNMTDGTDIHVSVAPETDLDSSFIAFWHDEQEPIRINGWLWTWSTPHVEESLRQTFH